MKIRTYSPLFYSPDELLGGASPDAPAAAPAAVDPSGQGEPTQAMYAQYLATVPEALRSQVEPAFKQWDADVTRKFQTHAEQAKTWEPYAELGIQDIAPEDMGHLKTFYEIAADPDAFKEWVKSAYESLHGEGSNEEVPGQPVTADEPEYLTADKAKELFQQQQAEAHQQAEQQRVTDEITAEMRETFDALKAKDPDLDEDLIAYLANRDHADSPTVKESIEAAHAGWTKRLGAIESDALDKKLTQPGAAITAGAPHSAPTPAKSIGDAGERLKERLRAAHAAG